MTMDELRADAAARHKLTVFVSVVSGALALLMLPATFFSAPALPRPGRGPAVKHQPVTKEPVVVATAGVTPLPVPVPLPALPTTPPDPLAVMLGKWQGHAMLERGDCWLTVELNGKADKKLYWGVSSLGCRKLGSKNDPTGFMNFLQHGTNATSARLSGTVSDDAIVLKATENLGVSEVSNGCDMAGMRLQAFGAGRLSVKWQETDKGLCRGGEMLLVPQR